MGIFPASPIDGWKRMRNMLAPFSIRDREEGRLEWWVVGRDFSRAIRKLRTAYHRLAGPPS